LWIATGDNLPFNATFVLKSLTDFSSEFSSLVHGHFCRPWMLGKPVDFQPVGYHIGGLLTDLDCFKESCCRIHRCHTMKFNVCFGFLFVSEFAWTHQVNAQCVPGNDFWIGLRWKQTCLLVTLFACCAVLAALADTCACGFKSNPCAALRHGELQHPQLCARIGLVQSLFCTKKQRSLWLSALQHCATVALCVGKFLMRGHRFEPQRSKRLSQRSPQQALKLPRCSRQRALRLCGVSPTSPRSLPHTRRCSQSVESHD